MTHFLRENWDLILAAIFLTWALITLYFDVRFMKKEMAELQDEFKSEKKKIKEQIDADREKNMKAAQEQRKNMYEMIEKKISSMQENVDKELKSIKDTNHLWHTHHERHLTLIQKANEDMMRDVKQGLNTVSQEIKDLIRNQNGN